MEMNHYAFIALGSNLGDSVAECRLALREITKIPDTKLVKSSSLFRTEPLLREGQKEGDLPWFVNAVCKVETALEAEPFFSLLRSEEHTSALQSQFHLVC